MKYLLSTITFLTIAAAVVAAQTPSRQALSSEPSNEINSAATRSRIVGPRVANHAERPRKEAGGNTTSGVNSSSPASPSVKSTSSSATAASALASIYRVGTGDVLDIRLPNTTTHDSTLYTIFKNGTIEYPLLSSPLAVAGMTTDEIARTLANQIKVIKAATVNVSMRDYASHSIVVGGLVDNPGKKILRREAVPLYALLAESSVRPEATMATIIRDGKEETSVSLKDAQAMSTLVSSGDAIRISGATSAASQYVYVGGDIHAAGEKTFRQGDRKSV